jgi:arginase family enzyme
MEPYFINIKTPFEVCSSEGYVKKTFDSVINLDTSNKDIYNEIYNNYKKIEDKKLVTISSTKAVSLITIPALNEKHIYRQRNEFVPGDLPQFKSHLKILYISSKPDFDKLNNWTLRELSSCVVSNSVGNLTSTVTKHNLLLELSQFLFFGISTEEIEKINFDRIKLESNGVYFDEDINGDKLKKTLKFIEKKFEQNEPVHIVFDLETLSQDISPLSFRYDYELKNEKNKGIRLDSLYLILESFKKLNIVGLDIVNFNLVKDDTSIINRIQAETIQRIYGTLLNLSVKTFNVFNENSRFLIFKPVEDIEDDIGWYILRGVPLEVRNELMNKIDGGQILTIKIDDEEDGEEKEIFVTTTTMFEQNEYSYYSSEDFLDKRLYPDEKIDMMFELINTVNC